VETTAGQAAVLGRASLLIASYIDASMLRLVSQETRLCEKNDTVSFI
jgi:hypothetical protein